MKPEIRKIRDLFDRLEAGQKAGKLTTAQCEAQYHRAWVELGLPAELSPQDEADLYGVEVIDIVERKQRQKLIALREQAYKRGDKADAERIQRKLAKLYKKLQARIDQRKQLERKHG